MSLAVGALSYAQSRLVEIDHLTLWFIVHPVARFSDTPVRPKQKRHGDIVNDGDQDEDQDEPE